MAFDASKREWSEIYSFFRLLADGKVYVGTPDMKKAEDICLPVAMLQRQEHDGTRRYVLKADQVHIRGEKIDKMIPRERFAWAAQTILDALKSSSDDPVESPQAVEEFLDEISLFDLEAQTDDRTDYQVAFYSVEAPLIGFCVRSRIGTMIPLLDGGRSANLKFEQSGIKFATPTIHKINALESANTVTDRILMIERLGGVLKYADVADKVFRSNLLMIDLHFPRLLAEMLRTMYLDGMTRISELTTQMRILNPLKIKEELITKHGFYEYKVKQFLWILAFGMRPAKLFNGTDSAVAGFIWVDGNGQLLCYRKEDKKALEDFLFFNTRFEKSDPDKDKYGYLERENGSYYFKLNPKIGFLKR